ncbi:unnamed protein product [Protopolystoma xenopodis]|uniref:Rho-GAP domain-containing protein n=1 Tax=Protopolystoma xenopodis TaxID=117903 RepID=A0A448X7Z5_9PLAT|nr:unnamed protein product [Protopolystoma xenopodis]
MGQAYRRRQSTHAIVAASSTGILFGVRIDQVVEREHRVVELIGQRAYSTALMSGRHGQQHMYQQTGLGELDGVIALPLIVRKCVDEVDKRGSEVVGIYRLSGSVWMKLQVRELFERATASMLNGLANEDAKQVTQAIFAVDLSPEKVPDIHAITGESWCWCWCWYWCWPDISKRFPFLHTPHFTFHT